VDESWGIKPPKTTEFERVDGAFGQEDKFEVRKAGHRTL
jgi:hypothetical protein